MHNRLLILSFYSLILNALFRPLNSSIATIFGYITILLAILYPVVRARYNGKVLIGKTPFAFICVLLISMISSISYFSTDNLRSQIIGIISFITFYWSLSLKPKENRVIYLQDICKTNYFFCAVLLLFGYGPFSFKYTVMNAWGYSVFTMGLGNPNAVSVYIMFAIALLLVSIVSQKRRVLRVIDFLIIALLFNLLLMLSSRTVVACALLLVFGYLIGKRSNKMQFFWWLVVAWPIVMILLTILLSERNITIQLLGKALETGRYAIYTSTISDLRNSPLCFVVGQVFKYRFSNMHNAPLTIVTNTGIVGLLIYLAFWYSEIKRLNDCCKNTVQRIAYYTMLAFIVQSSSESLSMVGTIPYAIMVIIVEKIANGEIANRNSILSSKEMN